MFIERHDSYEAIYRAFRWKVPEFYNIAHDVCDRHAGSTAPALIQVHENGTRYWSFSDIQRAANRLANVLVARSLNTGDRVAVLLGQDPEAAITHVAAWKAAMISVTMSRVFGPEGLTHRLRDSGARLLVTDLAGYEKIQPMRSELPDLKHVLLIDGRAPGAEHFDSIIGQASDNFLTLRTRAADPAFINYTSGTTGQPKGVLKAHAAMLAQMPAMEFLHDFYPQDGDLFWSPADWSWLAGMMIVLFAAWFYGKPVLAFRMRSFDPEQAFSMISKYRVRNSLLTPTMLKQMREVAQPRSRYDLTLRSVISGSEIVGSELLAWGREALGLDIHVAFGQTECNAFLGNNARVMQIKPGALGRPLPGHIAAIVDEEGSPSPVGTIGQIAIQRPDPKMMLEYWRDSAATRDKFAGDWMLTGDLGRYDEDGYFWYHARSDDVISSGGYRIGPGEIEDTLLSHSAVAMAAAIGVPDSRRQEVVKAFVVLRQGETGSSILGEDLKKFVGARLARHEAPREIEFVTSLPLTSTGKISRRELRERERVKRLELARSGS